MLWVTSAASGGETPASFSIKHDTAPNAPRQRCQRHSREPRYAKQSAGGARSNFTGACKRATTERKRKIGLQVETRARAREDDANVETFGKLRARYGRAA